MDKDIRDEILERATGIAFGDAPDVIFQYPDRVEAMRKLDGDAEYETKNGFKSIEEAYAWSMEGEIKTGSARVKKGRG